MIANLECACTLNVVLKLRNLHQRKQSQGGCGKLYANVHVHELSEIIAILNCSKNDL